MVQEEKILEALDGCEMIYRLSSGRIYKVKKGIRGLKKLDVFQDVRKLSRCGPWQLARTDPGAVKVGKKKLWFVDSIPLGIIRM